MTECKQHKYLLRYSGFFRSDPFLFCEQCGDMKRLPKEEKVYH